MKEEERRLRRLTAKERVENNCSTCDSLIPLNRKTGLHEGYVVYYCFEEKCKR